MRTLSLFQKVLHVCFVAIKLLRWINTLLNFKEYRLTYTHTCLYTYNLKMVQFPILFTINITAAMEIHLCLQRNIKNGKFQKYNLMYFSNYP